QNVKAGMSASWALSGAWLASIRAAPRRAAARRAIQRRADRQTKETRHVTLFCRLPDRLVDRRPGVGAGISIPPDYDDCRRGARRHAGHTGAADRQFAVEDARAA